jgi:hypothetical protein
MTACRGVLAALALATLSVAGAGRGEEKKAETPPRVAMAGPPTETGPRPAAIVDGETARTAPPSASASGDLKLLPVLMPAYRPETRWLLGGAVVLLQQPAAAGGKESQLQILGAATELGQYVLALRPTWYLARDAVQLTGALEFSRFPDEFYGIGNGAPASAREPYTPLYLLADLGPRFRVAPGLYLGPSLRVQHASMLRVAPGGQLAPGTVTGAAGGTTVQVGASAEWDTRDSTLYPRSGALVRLDLRAADPAVGSDFEFGLLRLDARRYLGIGATRHVLALQAVLELRSGAPPFYDTGKLGGGEIMRGWYAGRYRDRQLWSAQAEYRLPLVWRVGAVAFGSAGGVARDGVGLVDAVRFAGGGGLRVAPSARIPINLRLDVAYGNATSVYFGLGEAF